MDTHLYMTGKYIEVTDALQHVINCTVNDVAASFTVTNDELCSFGLYDKDLLLGYLGRNGLTHDYHKAELINGRFSPKVIDAPEGATIRKIESFYLSHSGVSRKRKTTH